MCTLSSLEEAPGEKGGPDTGGRIGGDRLEVGAGGARCPEKSPAKERTHREGPAGRSWSTQ